MLPSDYIQIEEEALLKIKETLEDVEKRRNAIDSSKKNYYK